MSGAGTGKLARPLARARYRRAGRRAECRDASARHRNTEGCSVSWRDGTGERTGLRRRLRPSRDVWLFVQRRRAEGRLAGVPADCRTARRFGCIWNHRDLDDPLQVRIEPSFVARSPATSTAARREDPTAVLAASDLFEDIQPLASRFTAVMTRDAVMDAWRSHGTLARQAGPAFDEILDAISQLLTAADVRVPYTTRGWYARFRA